MRGNKKAPVWGSNSHRGNLPGSRLSANTSCVTVSKDEKPELSRLDSNQRSLAYEANEMPTSPPDKVNAGDGVIGPARVAVGSSSTYAIPSERLTQPLDNTLGST